jgi:hypothetical protein
MTSNATDPLTLILSKLEGIQQTVTDLQQTVTDLSKRIASLEKEKTTSKVEPKKESKKVPAFLGAMAGLDEKKIPAEDKLAYATGYVAAKMGLPPDKLCLDIGVTDYSEGYDMGTKVSNQVVDPPDWDLSFHTN